MGRSHAKSNTKQANLTYYERQLLAKEGAARRIGNDSMKPLDHCNLCLSKVVDGVACSRAHVYCRECAFNDLLAQKGGIEAQKREMDAWEAEDERKKAEARAAARDRVVRDFERGMGLAGARKAAASRGSGDNAEKKSNGSAIVNTDEIDTIAREAEAAAAAAIESEASDSRKAKLAAFWLPSLTPEAPLGPLKAVKLQTLCHVGAEPHPHSRKALIPAIFTYAGGGSDDNGKKPICPSCAKELSNATGAVLLSSREPSKENGDSERPKKKSKKEKDTSVATCGHVVCRTCAETLVRPSKRCSACDAVVEEKGMIDLGREGTGFAAAGGASVKKAVTAFRV